MERCFWQNSRQATRKASRISTTFSRGIVENDGESVKDAAFSEALEETGYNWHKYYNDAHGIFRKQVPFRKGNNLMLYRINVNYAPPKGGEIRVAYQCFPRL